MTELELAKQEIEKGQGEKLTASGYLSLLRTNRHYRALWSGQVVSLLGDWFSTVAVVTLVARYGNAEALSLLFMLRLAPMILFGPFAGVLADRFNRRNLMLLADLSRAATALAFLLVGSASDLWLIYVLNFAQFSLGTVFDPSRSALIPAITTPTERSTASALGSLTWSSLAAIGAALGGLTAGVLGTEAAFVVDGISFLGSALFLSQIPAKFGQACGGQCGKLQLMGDLKEGIGYLKQHSAVFAYALVKPLMATVGGIIFVLLAIQAQEVYPLGKDGAVSLGLLNLAIGVGSGAGPLLIGRVLLRMGENRRNLQKLISFGFILGGAGYTLFCQTNLIILAITLVILAEIGLGSNWVFSTTLLQLSVEEKFRGRVFAVELIMMNFFSLISALMGGLLLGQLNLPIEAVGLGIGVLQIGIGLIWLWGALRHKPVHGPEISLSAGD